MLKILFLTDKDLLYFMGGKVQSAKTYLTWCFCEVITNQIMICKLLMSIRCREGVVLYSSKYKNKYIYIYIYIDKSTGIGYQNLFILVRKSETERLLWDTDLEMAKQH